MQTEIESAVKESLITQTRGGMQVVTDAPCSLDVAFEQPTPHAAIEAVIAWLGIGYQSTITRRSDGKKITIRITSENQEDKEENADVN